MRAWLWRASGRADDAPAAASPLPLCPAEPLRTAAGELRERCGWLLRLDDDQGAVGWGEVAPLQPQQFMACEQALVALPDELPQAQLEAVLREAPGPVGFGLGAVSYTHLRAHET